MNIESPFTSVFVYLLACVYSDNQYPGSILLNSQRIVLQKEVETIEKICVLCSFAIKKHFAETPIFKY